MRARRAYREEVVSAADEEEFVRAYLRDQQHQPGPLVLYARILLGAKLVTEGEAYLARALAESIVDVTGERAAFEPCPGLLEIRFYAERGVPALAYGPGILAVSHGPQEFVKIGRMVECAKIYALTALRVLG